MRLIKQELRLLPYREMMNLADHIAGELALDSAGCGHVAAILTDLPATVEEDEVTARSQQLLASFFNRKKNISITPAKNGWKLSVPSTGIEVCTDDIREGMAQLVEALVSYEAIK